MMWLQPGPRDARRRDWTGAGRAVAGPAVRPCPPAQGWRPEAGSVRQSVAGRGASPHCLALSRARPGLTRSRPCSPRSAALFSQAVGSSASFPGRRVLCLAVLGPGAPSSLALRSTVPPVRCPVLAVLRSPARRPHCHISDTIVLVPVRRLCTEDAHVSGAACDTRDCWLREAVQSPGAPCTVCRSGRGRTALPKSCWQQIICPRITSFPYSEKSSEPVLFLDEITKAF